MFFPSPFLRPITIFYKSSSAYFSLCLPAAAADGGHYFSSTCSNSSSSVSSAQLCCGRVRVIFSIYLILSWRPSALFSFLLPPLLSYISLKITGQSLSFSSPLLMWSFLFFLFSISRTVAIVNATTAAAMEDDRSSICPAAVVVSSTTTTFNHHYRDHHDHHHHIRAHISASPSQQRRRSLHRRRLMASSDLPQQQLCSTDLQDSASLEACECQCLFISKQQQQQQQQTLTLGCSSVSSPASFNSSSTSSLPLSPEKCSSSQQWQLRDEEEDEMFPSSFETKSAVMRTVSKFSHHHHLHHHPNHHPLPRRCSSSSSNTSFSSIFSRFPLIILLSLFLLLAVFTTGGHCDTPNSGHHQLNDREEGGNGSTGSFQFPGYSSSSPPRVPNRTLTLMQLSQLMRSGSGSGGNGLPRKIRQPAPISHYRKWWRKLFFLLKTNFKLFQFSSQSFAKSPL